MRNAHFNRDAKTNTGSAGPGCTAQVDTRRAGTTTVYEGTAEGQYEPEVGETVV